MSSANCITDYSREIIARLESEIATSQGLDKLDYADCHIIPRFCFNRAATLRNRAKLQHEAAKNSALTRARLFSLIEANAALVRSGAGLID